MGKADCKHQPNEGMARISKVGVLQHVWRAIVGSRYAQGSTCVVRMTQPVAARWFSVELLVGDLAPKVKVGGGRRVRGKMAPHPSPGGDGGS